MGILYSWQKLTRVMPKYPLGDGSNGDATYSSDPNTRTTATGSSGSASLSIGSAILSDGDVFIVHQTQGTGAGQYEVEKVLSGGGTTSITCTKTLHYNYVSGAQIIKFALNRTVTLNSFTPTSWNGSTGAIDVIVGNQDIILSGAFNGYGASANLGSPGTSGGFRGASTAGIQGEGTGGAGSQSTLANGNGGGGGHSDGANAMGGGGGNVSGGTGGNYSPQGSTAPGAGGSVVSSSDGTVISPGGGGGSSSSNRAGAAGGTVLIIFGNIITASNYINVDGGNGGANDGTANGGGSGAGGFVLLICQKATLGNYFITALGGVTPTAGDFGHGGGGGIAIHHSGPITGLTNPTYTDIVDLSIRQNSMISII